MKSSYISINGHKASNKVQRFLSAIGDYIWLYNQEDYMDSNTYLLNEQNHVEISYEFIDASETIEVTANCCEVHEYKEDDEMKDLNLIF